MILKYFLAICKLSVLFSSCIRIVSNQFVSKKGTYTFVLKKEFQNEIKLHRYNLNRKNDRINLKNSNSEAIDGNVMIKHEIARLKHEPRTKRAFTTLSGEVNQKF